MIHKQHWPQPVQEGLSIIGQLVQHARKAAGLTSAQLAQRAGIERKTLSRLEKGDPGIGLGLFLTVLWLLDIPLLQGIDIGHRQSRTQIALLLKSLDDNLARRVRRPTKKVADDFS
jgi:transcriptional regulator with XRE-family HTH domain